CSADQLRQVWIVASLKPTFLWRRIETRRPRGLSRVPARGCWLLTGVKCQRDSTTYATIFVKPAALIASRGNASTPTEPTKRCIVTFRLSVRNGKYKGQRLNCQAQAPQSGSQFSSYSKCCLQQMPNSPSDSGERQNEQDNYCKYQQLELQVAILTRRGQRTLRKIRRRCIGCH